MKLKEFGLRGRVPGAPLDPPMNMELILANIRWMNASAFLVTGRNEVLTKVIFSQACVILSTGGGGVWSRGGSPNFQGGSSKFSGGVPPNFGGGSSKISGGVSPNFRGGLHRKTVNVRPVRILLECILVLVNANGTSTYNNPQWYPWY